MWDHNLTRPTGLTVLTTVNVGDIPRGLHFIGENAESLLVPQIQAGKITLLDAQNLSTVYWTETLSGAMYVLQL